MKSFLYHNRRAYMIGIPIIAFVHFHLLLNAFGIGFGLEVAGESISFLHIVTIVVLGFPFFFVMPLFASMRPLLDDNQMLYLAIILSGLFWGFVFVTVACLISSKRRKLIHHPPEGTT